MTNFEYAATIGYERFSTKGAWFAVTGTRGNAKGLTGAVGKLMWLAIDGDPRALSSSPDRERVSRVGLAIPGRDGLVFLAPNHVARVANTDCAKDAIDPATMEVAVDAIIGGTRSKGWELLDQCGSFTAMAKVIAEERAAALLAGHATYDAPDAAA